MTKLADRYGNSFTPEMHKKLGPRGWQRSKIDCQQLGSEFRQPLIRKKYETILKITGTGGAVYRHWWRSVPALVAQCTGTGGAVCKGATPSVEQ